jgi:hypothetical protein
MPLHDTSYQHWDGVHLGIWGRRLVIARNGITSCLQIKGMRQVATSCWISALLMAALLFLTGQLLVADSLVVRWIGGLNPNLQTFAHLLSVWLEQHPEISVRNTQNVVFYYFCTLLLRVSIFTLGMIMPILITRDLASNAIIIYSSKAVNRGDYLLGKFATAFGMIAITWLGPICAAWLVGNLLAPDWRFFWHSRAAIAHVLLFGTVAMSFLSLLALGVSSISSKEKSTPGIWITWWIIGGIIAPIATQTLPWLRHLSFNYDLEQIAIGVFRIGDDIKTAQDNIPVLGELLRGIRADTIAALNSPTMSGAIFAMIVMGGAAAWVIAKRVKPE